VEVRFTPGHTWSVVRRAIAFGAVVEGCSIACILPATVIARELSHWPGLSRGLCEETFERSRAVVERAVCRHLEQWGVPPEGELLILTLED